MLKLSKETLLKLQSYKELYKYVSFTLNSGSLTLIFNDTILTSDIELLCGRELMLLGVTFLVENRN
jgi:hypothetical protein